MPLAHRFADVDALEELLVADSFRVRIDPQSGVAEVRGLGHHLARFARGADAASNGAIRGIGNFLDATSPQITAYGDGFPRWELWRAAHGGFELRLNLRPLPELGGTLSLVSLSAPARPHSDRKGPNISTYAALNRELGAEALLVGVDGVVREGATTSLVWWRGSQAFRAASKDRVASVTEALLGELLGALTPADITPAELANCEVWAVNALHGIRVVTSVDGRATAEADAVRLAHARTALDSTWQPFVAAER